MIHHDDLSDTHFLRIKKKARQGNLPDLQLSEGGHSLDPRGLPVIGVVEIELRDEEERKNFLRRIEFARNIFKNAK